MGTARVATRRDRAVPLEAEIRPAHRERSRWLAFKNGGHGLEANP